MQLHATTIAFEGAGLLILGPSGSGKSSLALDIMAVGAMLVADDRTDLHRNGDAVIASCPPPLLGLIEARGIGVLSAIPAGPVRVRQVVVLGTADGDRLPQSCFYDLLGVDIPLVRTDYHPHLHAALRQLLSGGRVA